VVITGGSSGIGAEVAQLLLRRGNRVTIVGDDRTRLDAAVSRLGTVSTQRIDGICCDIGQSADVAALAAALLGDGAAPDVLINNAGFGTYRPFEQADIAEIDRLIAVNLVGHIRLTKHLVGAMVQRRSGAISFITSIAGRVPITPNATYCAAKHGMMGFAEAIRYELRRFGIEVTAICPGRVETPFFDHPTFRERTRGPENRSSIPVDRVATAITKAIERGKFVTYVPSSLGIAAWLYEALPLVTRPVYSRLMGARIERLYADIAR
jgi:short-subunit dehydrogenase